MKTASKLVTVTIRIDPDIKAEIERAAEQDSRSFSSQVGIALREWLTSQPKVGKAVIKRRS